MVNTIEILTYVSVSKPFRKDQCTYIKFVCYDCLKYSYIVFFILAVTRNLRMASAAHICGICDLRHVTKSSVVWCPECDEGFCSGCAEHHSLAKATRHHKTTLIAEYQKLPPDILQIPQSCTKHNEKLLLYCKDHETPCCGKCANERHKKCQEVVNLDDIIKNAKTGTAFQEIEETLAEVVNTIKVIHKVYIGNIATLSENRKQIEKQIHDIRVQIDSHLNQLEKKLVNELQQVEETESKKVFQLLKTLEEKEDKLTNYQNTMANIKRHATDLQTFMSIKQMEQNLAKEEEFNNLWVDGDKMNIRVITCYIEESLKTITKNVERFGKISLETTFCEPDLKKKKKQQAQLCIPTDDNMIDNINAKLQQKIKTKAKNVRGCCILPNKEMAFTCFNTGKVMVIGNNGETNFEVELQSACDLTYVQSDNCIAASSNGLHSISIIDIQERKIKNVIQLESIACGLVERNNSFIFCTPKGIKIKTVKDQRVSDLKNVKLFLFSYIDTQNNKIYYSSFHDHSITCCDFQGRTIWTFEKPDTLRYPLGVSVDNEGYVYAVGENLGNVIIISPNGQRSRRLFLDSDCPRAVQVLFYDRSSNLLLVAERDSNAFLYKIERK